MLPLGPCEQSNPRLGDPEAGPLADTLVESWEQAVRRVVQS